MTTPDKRLCSLCGKPYESLMKRMQYESPGADVIVKVKGRGRLACHECLRKLLTEVADYYKP